MHRPCIISICKAILALLVIAHPLKLSAQEEHDGIHFSLGSVQSPKGAGISFSFDHEDYLSSVIITTDFQGILNGKEAIPGAKIRYNSLFRIADVGSVSGTPVVLYGGPGVVSGYCKDRKSDFGLIAGVNLTAGFGVEMRCFVLCLEFDAEAAIQLVGLRGGEDVISKFYHNGVDRAYWPSIRIEYLF